MIIEVFKDGFRFYIISFSLSRLYNGVNYSSYAPFDYEDLVKRLMSILEVAGFVVKDWAAVKLSRLDVFLNIELEHSYEYYAPILKTISLPRTESKSYETSKYLKNKRLTLMTYDKKTQLEKRKNLKIQDNVLRIELRYLKAQKIKQTFGVNLLHELKAEHIEKDFYKKLESAFSELGKFSVYPTLSLSRKNEFVKYFKEKKARFPEKLGIMVNSFYRKDKIGKLQELLSAMRNTSIQSEKSSEAQRKKKERDIKKALSFVNLGIFIDFEKRDFGQSLNLIKSVVFHRQLKIARLDEVVKVEHRRYNKNEGAMDFSMFSWDDVQRILLKAS
nr:hypothetical protein [Leptospira weilii]